ncbi:MAG: tyrosine-protein phosphatase [Gammaproteobacteria bacterium]
MTPRKEGTWHLDWRAYFGERPVMVRTAPDEAGIAHAPVVASDAVGEATVEGAGEACHPLFHLTADGGSCVVAARGMPLAGAVNFRDFGGYAAAGGRRLAWGRLFRSGHLSGLDADGKRLLGELGIRTVCDLRSAAEIANESAELPADTTVNVIGIPPGVVGKNFLHDAFASADGPQDIVDALHVIMAGLVREAAPYFRRLFEILLEGPAGAVLLNCSAGKERTGIASAMLMTALGVPRETIMYDFMLSERYFPAAAEVPRVLEKYAVTTPGEAGRALIWPLLETRASYLETALAAIEEDFGTVLAFLEENYALDAAARERLRELYTVEGDHR